MQVKCQKCIESGRIGIPDPNQAQLKKADQLRLGGNYEQSRTIYHQIIKRIGVHMTPGQKNALARIHAELDLGIKNALPIAAGYCGNLLKCGPTKKGRQYFFKDVQNVGPGARNNPILNMTRNGRIPSLPDLNPGSNLCENECGTHASVIMGRRKNPKTNRCQFLIKNTFQDKCSTFYKGWDCDSTSEQKIWVDSQEVAANLVDAYSLEKASH